MEDGKPNILKGLPKEVFIFTKMTMLDRDQLLKCKREKNCR